MSIAERIQGLSHFHINDAKEASCHKTISVLYRVAQITALVATAIIFGGILAVTLGVLPFTLPIWAVIPAILAPFGLFWLSNKAVEGCDHHQRLAHLHEGIAKEFEQLTMGKDDQDVLVPLEDEALRQNIDTFFEGLQQLDPNTSPVASLAFRQGKERFEINQQQQLLQEQAPKALLRLIAVYNHFKNVADKHVLMHLHLKDASPSREQKLLQDNLETFLSFKMLLIGVRKTLRSKGELPPEVSSCLLGLIRDFVAQPETPPEASIPPAVAVAIAPEAPLQEEQQQPEAAEQAAPPPTEPTVVDINENLKKAMKEAKRQLVPLLNHLAKFIKPSAPSQDVLDLTASVDVVAPAEEKKHFEKEPTLDHTLGQIINRLNQLCRHFAAIRPNELELGPNPQQVRGEQEHSAQAFVLATIALENIRNPMKHLELKDVGMLALRAPEQRWAEEEVGALRPILIEPLYGDERDCWGNPVVQKERILLTVDQVFKFPDPRFLHSLLFRKVEILTALPALPQ